MKNIVLITGASKGIGKALAEHFASLNQYDLVLTSADNELSEVKSSLEEKYKCQVETCNLDFRKEKDIKKIVSRISKEWKGKIEILVNNAGVLYKGLFESDSSDGKKIEELLEVNFLGHYYITQAVIPFMKQNRKGYIFNIASLSGKRARPELGMYAISKFSMMGFNEALYEEMIGRGVKVTAICPSVVNTPMTRNHNLNDNEKIQPKDITEAVKFVMSLEENACIKEICIDCKKSYLDKIGKDSCNNPESFDKEIICFWINLVKEYFESHVKQRFRFFNFYIVVLSGMLIATYYLHRDHVLDVWLSLLGVVFMTFLSFIFCRLDKRAHSFINNAENIFKVIEEKLKIEKEIKIFTLEEKKTESDKKNYKKYNPVKYFITYRDCVVKCYVVCTIIYAIFVVLLSKFF